MKFLLLIVVGLLATAGYNGVRNAQYAQHHVELVGEIQTLKNGRDLINAQWTQLLVEQKMLADDSIISHMVRTHMDMHLPDSAQVVYLDR